MFALIHAFGRLISYLPRPLLRGLAALLGSIAYYAAAGLRKTALSNISLAFPTLPRHKVRTMARHSFCHLGLTLLEYGLIERKKGNVSSFVSCLNPDQVTSLKEQYGGIVYVSAHQANWEVPFIETNNRASGTAVGRPLKTEAMTNWINKIRSLTGGSIVSPREAMHTAKKTLAGGTFFGFVGDQALPESSYSGEFFGRLAFSTSAPALLAYKHNVPVVVALTVRRGSKQLTWYTPPLLPNRAAPLKKEVTRLSDAIMRELEIGIVQAPEQWMWLHNRWKRPTGLGLLKEYRYETILIIYPKEFEKLQILKDMSLTFRLLYPHHDISVCLPSYQKTSPVEGAKVYTYETEEEAKIDSYEHKLIYNFTTIQGLESYYKKRAALTTLGLDEICKRAHLKSHEELFADFTKHLVQLIYEEEWAPTDFLQLINSKRETLSPSMETSTTT